MARLPESATRGLALVLVTPGDRGPQPTLRLIRDALHGGVGAILLREPRLARTALRELAGRAREVTRAEDALLIVHGDIDLALDCDADGVHTGHGGPGVDRIRREAPGLLAGRSCHWPVGEEDRRADYVLLSPFRGTHRSHPRPLLEEQQVRACLDDPQLGQIVALGGLGVSDVSSLPAGLAGFAVMRALSEAPDVRHAAAALRAAWDARLAAAT